MKYIAMSFAFFSLVAFGEDVPSTDLMSEILKLVMNWKTMGAAAIGISVVLISMEVLKKFFGDFQYKTVIATVLSVAYTVLIAVAAGQDLWQSVFTVLVVGGGAMKIYDAIKASVEKKQLPYVPGK